MSIGEKLQIVISNETKRRLDAELQKAEQLNNIRLYKIVRSLQLLVEQRSVEEICGLLHVKSGSIYNWVARFIVDRFSWLVGYHFRGRGRKPKLSRKQKRKLYEIVAQGPEAYGFDCGVWNSAMIVEVVQREFNVTYNPRYICTILKGLGLSYQKAKFVSDRLDDPKHIEARRLWKNVTWPKILEDAKKRGGVILFGDEVSFAQWGSLARTWVPRGTQPQIKTCGKRKGMKIFGVIEFGEGNFIYQECEGKFNGESYEVFLRYILSQYSCPVFLIEDGASYHKSKTVKLYTEEMRILERLFVYSLPAYSPDYNPIEKLWKQTKKDATHLKYFPTFDDLRRAVLKAFEKYLNDASRILCVMKSMRTKAGLA